MVALNQSECQREGCFVCLVFSPSFFSSPPLVLVLPDQDSSVMDQAVFQTLTDTLSSDTNTRLTAELRLNELQVNPGTHVEQRRGIAFDHLHCWHSDREIVHALSHFIISGGRYALTDRVLLE